MYNSWAEINLDAIAYNMSQIRKKIGPKVKVLVPVKANGYGHGIIDVSNIVLKNGAEMLGVATLPEAITLRKSGIKSSILMMAPLFSSDAFNIIKFKIEQTVCDLELSKALNLEAKKQNRKIDVHIKVDTGMGRIGVLPLDTVNLALEIKGLKYINLKGIFTHFPSADCDSSFTKRQIAEFKILCNKLEKCGVHIPIKHTANSAAVLLYPESYFDMVRPGLITYGLYSDKVFHKKIKLKPALSWKTRVVFLKEVLSGTSRSYGRTFIAKRRMKVATLSVGYGDGYNRLLSNSGIVLIHGIKARVIGRVCMDQIMVDVSHIPNVKIGDEVILIGNTITAEEIADKIKTIPYEVVCMISSRVPRVFDNHPNPLY